MEGKKILLAVTGSIAAYKVAPLVRLFVKAGAEVQVLMTAAAKDFITPLTLSTLSRRPVYSDISSDESWNDHVRLGVWADIMIVAPATANTLSKLACGLCDNIVSAVYLSARCPVFVAPAMDLDMWKHPATQANVRQLQQHGVHLIQPGYGELASGLVGEGRMAEPEEIFDHLQQFFNSREILQGKNIMLTAGPTYEALDPVRFIGNRSSGKMGIALAETFAKHGAAVTLILGPSALQPQHPAIRTIRVESAQEMYEAALRLFPNADIAVFAAAVADYRPVFAENQKIKKTTDTLTISLKKNPDIAATLGAMKRPGQITIGFALETNDELANARDKLLRKNFDFIVLNSLRDSGAGFQHDTNKITILHRDNKQQTFELKNKTAVAEDIVREVIRAAGLIRH